jgi:glycosyltransferase involved in cell wall biosynthesis
MTKPTGRISVCFINLRAYPLLNPDCHVLFGGTEVALSLLAIELAKDSRFDVSVVVGDYAQPDIEVRHNVRIIKSLDTTRSYPLQAGKLWKAFNTADADIYLHSACSLITPLTAMFCRLRHRRFFYRTAHMQETNGAYLRRHPVRGRLVLWAFGSANRLVTQNIEDQQRLKQRFGLESTVIRNACRLKQQQDSRRNTFLWVGRSDPFKQPHLFIKLARSFSQYPFVMICSPADNDLKYEALAQQARDVSNLTFIPGLPFEQADTYFEKARLYISTSDSEGFPNTFVQACKAGTPILSLSVNPDLFLDHYDCGRCANGDWERFLALFNELIVPQTAFRMGQNGLNYAREHHDIKSIIESYKALFMAVK